MNTQSIYFEINCEEYIDLKKIFEGGQIFSWDKYKEGYKGLIDDNPFVISWNNSSICVETSLDEHLALNLISNLFDLKTSVTNVEYFLNGYNDSYMNKAIKVNNGLRILNQDPWTCIATFICSSVANFNKISLNVKKLSENFGNKIKFQETHFYTFPKPQVIAQTSIDLLNECGLGFRSKYLLAVATKITQNEINLDNLKRIPYIQSRNILENLYGIGSKIADCVLLYSLNKSEAFPIDRWVQRALFEAYNIDQTTKYSLMSDWARKKWGKYAGYAQQYLFQYQKEFAKQ